MQCNARKQIFSAIKNPDTTDKELQDALEVKQSRFYILAYKMKAAGLIKIMGR